MAEDKNTEDARAPGQSPADDAACVEHREELLDEALDESFPASDPPSIARPPGRC